MICIIFVKGTLQVDKSGWKKYVDEAEVVSGKPPGIEIYQHSRYFTFTGSTLNGDPNSIMPRQEALDDIIEKHFKDRLKPTSTTSTTNGPGNSLSAQQVFDRAVGKKDFRILAEGKANTEKYPSDSEVELAIVNRLCRLTAGDLDKTMAVIRMLPIYDAVKKEHGQSKWERTIPNYAWDTAYRYWGGDAGITRLLTKKSFVDRLKRFGIKSKRGAKGQRFLDGVKLKRESELTSD